MIGFGLRAWVLIGVLCIGLSPLLGAMPRPELEAESELEPGEEGRWRQEYRPLSVQHLQVSGQLDLRVRSLDGPPRFVLEGNRGLLSQLELTVPSPGRLQARLVTGLWGPREPGDLRVVYEGPPLQSLMVRDLTDLRLEGVFPGELRVFDRARAWLDGQAPPESPWLLVLGWSAWISLKGEAAEVHLFGEAATLLSEDFEAPVWQVQLGDGFWGRWNPHGQGQLRGRAGSRASLSLGPGWNLDNLEGGRRVSP